MSNNVLTKKGYYIYEWDDETSQFDPKGIWVGGSDYFIRTYKAWIPNHITNDDEIQKYIDDHADDPELYIE